MDPDATMELIMEAIDSEDPEEASELIEALLNWLRDDGFMPTVTREQLCTLLAHTGMVLDIT